MINADIIHEIVKLKLPFPESIKRLSEINIERYYTDLVRMEKIYYATNGDTYIERMPVEDMPKLDNHFNESGVIEVLRSIQRDEIDYHTFLRKIVTYGTASYTVYIHGKKAIYSGKSGELHIEKFPFSF